jgi:nucleotide-binding universal stress UspA family protein
MTTVNSEMQTAFENILFATDLSQGTESAVPYVIETARLYGSKVHAVHVKTEEWDDFHEKALQRLQQQLADVRHEVRIEPGEVRTTLLDLAAEKGTDLIVLGTHGRTGLGRVLLGSVAETIFRQASCPVMTVGPRHRGDLGTPLIKEILYATDLTPASASAARFVLSLAQKTQARLTILTVLPENKAADAVAHSEHEVTLTLRTLEALVPPDTQLPSQPCFVVERGDAADKILETANKCDADLIVLGVRPHLVGMATHVSRRTAHEVVTAAPCPVLTVPGFGPCADCEKVAHKGKAGLPAIEFAPSCA